MISIDFNCDLGELEDENQLIHQEKILNYISSANVSCGSHAGTDLLIKSTIESCIKKNILIGAHPSFEDRENFGRKIPKIIPLNFEKKLINQIIKIKNFLTDRGKKLNHVKPHGALYNLAFTDKAISEIIVNAIREVDVNIKLYAQYNSVLLKIGKEKGLKCLSEVFVDRRYDQNGALLPRNRKNSVIKNKKDVLDQLKLILSKKMIKTDNQILLPVSAGTICFHGDNPHTLNLLKYCSRELKKYNYKISKL